ncbi:clathrin interactor EPSIN 1 [Phalaenopsis equestris]|uniref:clathrin interactor EPSIN 1 n=1 Tax=Phalaenopsis equestris TaxID=78828 RepID=UPI0009E5D3BD|nr:clathrin interactor EPSIN 1 [Phalaenopsis equestris]
MDFMKVLDQTVREIKREVNLKVLKVPEIEQKVLDATNDEPWGPHGSTLSELAQATKKFTECQMIMNVLWTRVGDKTANWRHIYKALSVIEYLIANGSERAIDNILEQSHQISSLSDFEFVEPNGKDVGINVRKKVETILALLGDKEKIQAVRNKADATRDKYFGLSSTGITYKSSSTSYSGSSFRQSEHYGTSSGTREDESFRDSFRDGKQNHGASDGLTKSKEGFSKEKDGSIMKKGVLHSARNQNVSAKPLPKPGLASSASRSTKIASNDDELDDFNPRGSTKFESTNINSPQVDLFGESLLGDLLDAPTFVPTDSPTLKSTEKSEVDLFADAAFVSAAPQEGTSSNKQANVDLFSNQNAIPATFPSNAKLFAETNSGLLPESKSSNPTAISSFDPFAASDSIFPSESKLPGTNTKNSSTADPFAAIPVNIVAGPDDLFGSFTSNAPTASKESSGDFSNTRQPAPKKEPFQVKSGIWADSLSRGLIDLNITASKKANLADIGVVGGLNDESNEKERAPPPPSYRGRAMGAGSGLGRTTGFSSSTTAEGTTWNLSNFQS